jgi:hypothetical protein
MDLDLKSLSRQESMYHMPHNHYIVTGHVPSSATRRGTTTFRFSCVCRDAERAIELAKIANVGAVINAVAHHGQIEKVEI